MKTKKLIQKKKRSLSALEIAHQKKDKDLEIKSQLLTFNFFQNLLNTDEFSRSIAYSLMDEIEIINYNKGELVSLIYNLIDTVYFLIKGSIANYEKIPKYIDSNTIPDNLIKEGHVFGFETDYYEYTSKTISNCTLGHISKDLFATLVNKHYQYSLKNELSFFFNLTYFKGIKRSNIGFLVANSQKLLFKRGAALTIQGNPCDSIFIVRQGQIKLSYIQTVNHRNDFDIDYFESISDIKDRFSTPRIIELFPSYNEKRLLSIIIITNGDIIGDFELKYRTKQYYFNSNCELNNSIVYRFDIELFKRILLEKNSDFIKYLLQKEKLFLDLLNTALKNTKKKQSKYSLRILEKTPEVNNNEKRRLKSSNSHYHFKSTFKKKMVHGTFDLNKITADNINVIYRNSTNERHFMNACSRNHNESSMLFNSNTCNELAYLSIDNAKTLFPSSSYINKPSLNLFKTNLTKPRRIVINRLNKKIDSNKLKQLLDTNTNMHKDLEINNKCKDIRPFSLGFDLTKLIHNNNDSNAFNNKLNSFLMNKNHSKFFHKSNNNL